MSCSVCAAVGERGGTVSTGPTVIRSRGRTWAGRSTVIPDFASTGLQSAKSAQSLFQVFGLVQYVTPRCPARREKIGGTEITQIFADEEKWGRRPSRPQVIIRTMMEPSRLPS